MQLRGSRRTFYREKCMTIPKVTAVIAAYRAGEYLRHSIRSALAQTRPDLEVLVSDDADEPEVRHLAESFGDSRVRYRSNARRLGPAGNHWAALLAARGWYIAILNHDDLWRPDYLATVVPVLESTPDAVLVFCDHDVIDPAGRSLSAEADRTTEQWGRDKLTQGLYRPFSDLVARQSIPVATGCLFRRDAVEPNTLPEVGPAYDLWLAYALCRTGGGAYYIADRLTAWRVHPEQITATRDDAWARGSLACWQAMAQDPIFGPARRAVRRRLADAACALGVAQLATGNLSAASSAARLAIRSRPTNRRAWVIAGLSLLPRSFSKRVTGKRHYQSVGSALEGSP
jgi:glycosyltransferase involved in cell wall biosynthesis